MKEALSFQTLVLFALFVLPGLTSIVIWRLVMPARVLDWAQGLIQGLFYSTVNYVLLLPLVVYVHQGRFSAMHPFRYWAAVLFIVLVAPMVWPLLLSAAFRSPGLSRKLRLPFPTVWDYVFDRREPAFVLLRLTDGRFIWGYWGPGSYAGVHPNDGDLYLSAVYNVDENGDFGEPVPNTAGLHIRRDQYSYVEFFHRPEQPGPKPSEQSDVDLQEN